MQRPTGNLKIDRKHESLIDPVLEKPLLSLHRAMNVRSFWKAVQQVVSVAIPNRVIGLTLQHNPVLPMIARWSRPMPRGFFSAEPFQSYVARRPRKQFVRFGKFYGNRNSFIKSAFYRTYMTPQHCTHGMALFFWKRERLVCVIAIMRSVEQGDLSATEIKLLHQLYPQFSTTLRRLESLERQRSVITGLEEFMGRLPLPTIVLSWTLKAIYQNRAAREFCALWEKGPEDAKRTKATACVPSELLAQCRRLKQQWLDTSRANSLQTSLEPEQVHHPRLTHLRATIHLKQLKSAGVARPHFFIRCENLGSDPVHSARPGNSHLPVLAALTAREQEVTRLACEGRSNQEIADSARLSLPMVKKHLHSVFRKLEVPSRSRLVAMML